MSRMMNNLARVLSREKEPTPDRPNLQLVKEPSRTDSIDPTKTRRLAQIGSATLAIATLSALAIYAELPSAFLPDRNMEKIDETVLALDQIRAGKITEAESLLRAYVANHPEARIARINHGYSLKALGRLADAEATYHEVIRRHGPDPYALNNLGVVQSLAGKNTEAEKSLNAAIQLLPTYADARLNLARILERTNRLDLALSQYRLYIESPSVAPALAAPVKDRYRKLHSVNAGRRPAGANQEKF